MNRFEFLSSLKEQGDIKQIRDTWAALGSLEVNSNTKVYIKDTICKITSDNNPIVNEKPATVTGNFLTQLQNMLQLPGSKLTLKQEDIEENSGIENSTWILENDKGLKKLTIKTKIVGHFSMETILNIIFQDGEMIVYDDKDLTRLKRYTVHKSINHYITFKTFDKDELHFTKISYKEGAPISDEEQLSDDASALNNIVLNKSLGETGDDLFDEFSAKLYKDHLRLKLKLNHPSSDCEYSFLEFFCTEDNNVFVEFTVKYANEINETKNVLPVVLVDEMIHIISGIDTENEKSISDKYLIRRSLINDVSLVKIVDKEADDNVEYQVSHYFCEEFKNDKSIENTEQDLTDIIEQGPLIGALVYVLSDYSVAKNNGLVNWDSLNYNDIDNSLVSMVGGVISPHFRILLTADEMKSVEDIPIDEDLIPFSNESKSITGDFNISDDELELILGELGVPFITVDELEYTRDILVKKCVVPAIKEYYTFFPIIKEEAFGNVGSNQEFKIEYPEGAYAAVAFFTQGTGASLESVGPFGFYAQAALSGVGYNGKFGNGLRYNKQVPGFVGLDNNTSYLMNRAAQQGYINYHRREKILHRFVDEKTGKVYAKGFSTIGGMVNIKWLCWSNDWNDIRFIDISDVRALATSYALRNIGMLRAQVKSDAPNNIDFSLFNTRSSELREHVIKKWEGSSTNLNLAPLRGGL